MTDRPRHLRPLVAAFATLGLVLASLVLAPAGTTAAALEEAQSDARAGWIDEYRSRANRLIGEALGDHFAWRRLAELTDRFGHRLSGTPQLEAAIAWAADEMRRDGLEEVRTERVMVP